MAIGRCTRVRIAFVRFELAFQIGTHASLFVQETLFHGLQSRLHRTHLTAEENVTHLVQAFRRRR